MFINVLDVQYMVIVLWLQLVWVLHVTFLILGYKTLLCIKVHVILPLG